MSRYIEFTRDLAGKRGFARGNPVHNGELPTRFLSTKGVLVDGELVTFAREDRVEVLHRALVEGMMLAKRGQGFDCHAFALLMGGVDLLRATRGKKFRVDTQFDPAEQVACDDLAQNSPVAISAWHKWMRRSEPIHTAVPAHLPDGASYLHKLGDAGPVCLSGLRSALNIVGGNQANSITAMTVCVKNKPVASWAE